MGKVITLSRVFMKGHPKAGKPTYFVEKALKSLYIVPEGVAPNKGLEHLWDTLEYLTCSAKIHTIRSGKRWKAGDKSSLRVWSGKPYASPQMAIAPEFSLPRVADIEICDKGGITIDGKYYGHMMEATILAENDGLSLLDFSHWIGYPFSGQILFFTNTKTPY